MTDQAAADMDSIMDVLYTSAGMNVEGTLGADLGYLIPGAIQVLITREQLAKAPH